jgi:hypothetical protein
LAGASFFYFTFVSEKIAFSFPSGWKSLEHAVGNNICRSWAATTIIGRWRRREPIKLDSSVQLSDVVSRPSLSFERLGPHSPSQDLTPQGPIGYSSYPIEVEDHREPCAFSFHQPALYWGC